MRLSIGTYISIFTHAALVVWLLVEGRFNSNDDNAQVEVAQVSVISAEVFDVMQNNTSPVVDVQNTTLDQPDDPEPAPDVPVVTEDAAVSVPQIETVNAPSAAEAPPNLPQPTPDLLTPLRPELDVLEPPTDAQEADQPSLQSVDRVAAQAVAPSPLDVAVDDIRRTATTPSIEAPDVNPVEAETTAPKAATTQIVTEADETAPQITSAPRPLVRPAPAPTLDAADLADALPENLPDSLPEPEPEPTPAPVENSQVSQDDIENLLFGLVDNELAAAETTSAAPVTLTASEAAGLKSAISECWNLGTLSSSAMATTVVVTFEMSDDARPLAGSITMVGYTGGSENDADKAFIAAKDAILACGSRGYNLPKEKFESWRNIQLTFNPENMRRR